LENQELQALAFNSEVKRLVVTYLEGLYDEAQDKFYKQAVKGLLSEDERHQGLIQYGRVQQLKEMLRQLDRVK
jgi:hypothetical protein